MELVSQHVKGIMEECKIRARDAGLCFDDETLEYIVTNRDMIELSPKVMIPTLYDYWVHDVRVLSGKGMYELYPSNPYETVINTRPAISYYNDNNPDWLNVMIFYHVLGHIDFFQNNLFYKNTWDIDLTGQALSDKRLISRLRAEKGRWVDYAIEFSRGIDNIVSYHKEINQYVMPRKSRKLSRVDFYFDTFLQVIKKVSASEYLKEIERYNLTSKEEQPVDEFFTQVTSIYPEFDEMFRKAAEKSKKNDLDVMEYIMTHSVFLREEDNKWMKSIMQIVRNTSLYFQPQIRTKIMNEGWASFWHDYLFMNDDRINGHETDYAKVNAQVTAMPKVGLNPYALGLRLFDHIMDMEDKGRYSLEYFMLRDELERREFNGQLNTGFDRIFKVREDYCDFTFINQFVDQEFMNRHELFVAGKRLNQKRLTWEYFIKSKNAGDYRQMIIDTLYHPPVIDVVPSESVDGILFLKHTFEHKPLKTDFLENTMIGIEYLWGGPVKLETHEPAQKAKVDPDYSNLMTPGPAVPMTKQERLDWKKVVYTMEKRKLTRQEQ
ncbi:MAG: SpoVR family protein [Desulfobacteraceae bacterium]|nr:MAG: SpoVR family protein [Desulfobacteraceae bacterium]